MGKKRKLCGEGLLCLRTVRMCRAGFQNLSLDIGCVVCGGVITSLGDVSTLRGVFLIRESGLKWGINVQSVFGSMIGWGVGVLYELFPRLFRVVSNKNVLVKECYVPLGSNVSWVVSFRRVLR